MSDSWSNAANPGSFGAQGAGAEQGAQQGQGAADEVGRLEEAKRRILAAALPNAAFDGWTEELVRAAAEEAGVDAHVAKLAFPRGGVDLAVFFHLEGDREMAKILAEVDLAAMRIRERVAMAVRTRLDVADTRREAVRRGAALFALPLYAADGARSLWGTADAIWTALDDPSEDLNWYTKRATLSGVYGSTLLYWLGDASDDFAATQRFLERRIDDVMRVEKVKSMINDNPLGRLVMTGPNWLASQIRKPGARSGAGGEPETAAAAPVDLPG